MKFRGIDLLVRTCTLVEKVFVNQKRRLILVVLEECINGIGSICIPLKIQYMCNDINRREEILFLNANLKKSSVYIFERDCEI